MADTQATEDDATALLAVRATVNLSGLRAGETALVDPASPYIRALLQARRLVPLDEQSL